MDYDDADLKTERISFNNNGESFLEIDIVLKPNINVSDIESITNLITKTLTKYFDTAFFGKIDIH